eukprot:292897_1
MTALPVTSTNWNFVEDLKAKDGKFNHASNLKYDKLEAAVKGLPITEDVASIFRGAHLVTKPTPKALAKPAVKSLIVSKKLIVCHMNAENRLYYTINPGTHTVTIIGKTGGHEWHIGHTAHRDYENEYDDNSYDAAAAMLGYGYNDNHYIDYSNGGQYYLGPPVSNGYNGYNGHMKKEHLVHVESPFSLSSAEIYNIEYSSKYKESMDFKNIQKMFNKYHQIKLFYAQSESTNGGITTDHVFFKDLDATLTTIGCMDQDKKMFFITCRQHIINKMVHTINVCKNQYEYLATITLLTGPLILRLDQVERNNYWSVLSDASFVSKLAISYDDWMINNKKSENEFKNEISGALHINPIYIRINGVGKGLEDIVIDWTVMYIWIPYYIQGVTTNLIYREYRMRPQDQIEVQYDKKWIPCTILEVKDTLNKKGKQIKVRYNKLNGNDRYFTNTEWLWTIKHYDRLRLPDQVYVIVSYNGVKIGTTFKPPLLAYVRGGNKKYLDIGHHIFVNRDNIWYRCEIINVSMETDKAIQVLYLVNTFVKNTEWLTLSDNHHLKRISLEDMRIL